MRLGGGLFDCFTFFQELDVLELRLAELADVVDRFVLVEGALTFTGRPKPLVFKENRERFSRYLHKIEHVVLEESDYPKNVESAWTREYFSRRAILRGLADAAPDDFVLISDVDEIPKPEVLSQTLADPASARQLSVFESTRFMYYFNLKATNWRPSLVQAPRMLQRRYCRDPQAVRAFKPRISKRRNFGPLEAPILAVRALASFGYPLQVRIEPLSSWHFTYYGSPDQMRAKLLAYSHTEKATPDLVDTDAIDKAVANRTNLFDQGEQFEVVPLDEELPKSLRLDPQRWRGGLTRQRSITADRI